MTAYELAGRMTTRELLQWDEKFALEAEEAERAAGRPVVSRRKRRR